jgi:hypothetical protein
MTQKKATLTLLKVRVQGEEADKMRAALRACYNDLVALMRHAKKELNKNETYSSANAGVRFRNLLRHVDGHVKLLVEASLEHDKLVLELKKDETTKQKTKAYRRNLNQKRKDLKSADEALIEKTQTKLKTQASKRNLSRKKAPPKECTATDNVETNTQVNDNE